MTEYLTLDEVAAHLAVERSEAAELIRVGGLPTRISGPSGEPIIATDDLNIWIENRTVTFDGPDDPRLKDARWD